jgi:hypothetical protein
MALIKKDQAQSAAASAAPAMRSANEKFSTFLGGSDS